MQAVFFYPVLVVGVSQAYLPDVEKVIVWFRQDLRLEDNPGVDLFQLSPADLMDRLFNDKSVMAEFMDGMDDEAAAKQLDEGKAL